MYKTNQLNKIVALVLQKLESFYFFLTIAYCNSHILKTVYILHICLWVRLNKRHE
jgi:hypothetical protein